MLRANAHVVHSVEVFCFRLSLRVGASGAYRAAQGSGRMLMTAAFTYRAKELTRVCVCVCWCVLSWSFHEARRLFGTVLRTSSGHLVIRTDLFEVVRASLLF